MADQKVTYRKIFKDTFQGKGWFKKYALFTLVVLALAFVTTYLNSVVPFLGAILLIVFLFPLIITYAEYATLVETGSQVPRDFRGFRNLFTNTYRSGRVRVILTFQMIIKFFLFSILGMFVSVLIFYFIIANSNAPLFAELQSVMNEALNSETPEQMLAKLDIFVALLVDYEAPFFVTNQVIQSGILIAFVNQSIFRVFTSVFIQQQPMTSLKEINTRFFSDKESKKLKLTAGIINVSCVLLIYGLVYVGTFLLLYYNTQSPNIVLQADLISLLILVSALPFVVRFNFYMYRALAKRKEVEIMEFTISELKNILRSPYVPEETRPYIAEILKMRMSELEKMKSIDNQETVSPDEVSPAPKRDDGDQEVDNNDNNNEE